MNNFITTTLRRILASLGIASLILSLLSSPPATVVAEDLPQPTPSQTYTHDYSNFRFPPKIDAFHRGTITKHDQAGKDISVGYDHFPEHVTMTVYVYPVPALTGDRFENELTACKAAVTDLHPDAKLASETEAKIFFGRHQRTGKHVIYNIPNGFGKTREPVRSELYLFTKNDWFIKYRVTYPRSLQTNAQPAIQSFMDKLIWP